MLQFSRTIGARCEEPHSHRALVRFMIHIINGHVGDGWPNG
jgi:hypothetical protein